MLPPIHIVTAFFFLNTVLAYIQVDIATNSTHDQVIKCVIKIANEKFNYRFNTAVLSKDVDVSLVNKFLTSYNGSVIIETKRYGTPPKQVVIIVESFQSFVQIMSRLKPDLKGRTLLNGGARFLIHLNNRKKIERITNILWSYYVTDAVIVVKDRKGRIAMYTYLPYKNHLNCHNTDPVLIDYCQENVKLPKDLYPDKMRNMHRCPMYISTNKLYHPITEQKIPLQVVKKTMIRLLRDTLNFTPMISTKDYISIDSDLAKNWSDSLNDVIVGLANISTCTIPLGADRLGLLDYSMPYFRIRLAWLAPPLVPGPPWWRLLSPLNGYLWLILLILILFVKALPFTLKYHKVKRFCYRYFKNSKQWRGIGIRIWGILVGQPVRVMPTKFRDFYIVSLWIWFTFVLRSAYQSVLIGALKSDFLVGNFDNLKETITEGYQFGGRAGMYVHFEFDPLIRDGFEIIPERKFETVFRDVIEGKKKFVLAASLEYAFAHCIVQGKKETECGHVLPDSIMTVPLVIWMKMYSPLSRSLSVWLPRLVESGLLYREAMMRTTFASDSKSTDPTPLTWNQTMSCMLCLLLGYLISLAVFVLEILTQKTAKYSFMQRYDFYL